MATHKEKSLPPLPPRQGARDPGPLQMRPNTRHCEINGDVELQPLRGNRQDLEQQLGKIQTESGNLRREVEHLRNENKRLRRDYAEQRYKVTQIAQTISSAFHEYHDLVQRHSQRTPSSTQIGETSASSSGEEVRVYVGKEMYGKGGCSSWSETETDSGSEYSVASR